MIINFLVNSWKIEAEKQYAFMRWCDRLKFASNDKMKEALKKAPRKLREWTFVK